MNTRTITELERDLGGPSSADVLGSPDLDQIRRSGRSRSRARRAAVAAGATLAVATVAAISIGVIQRDPGPAGDLAVATDPIPTPTELSPLAKRTLREIRGAEKVSDWQVVLPAPGTPPRRAQDLARDYRVDGGPVPLDADVYAGVTAYPRSAFPRWLYDETERIEQEEFGDKGGYPVGSTDTGILVQNGTAALACLAWTGGESHPGSSCSPSLVSELEWTTYLEWGMGTDDFLMPGTAMEVFLSEDYSTGRPSTLAIGGLDGTDVARVDFVSTTGAVVEGEVEAGTLAPGDSLFHANVPGELARVIAYDAGGDVIEDHALKPCDTPVECEVR